MSGGGDKGKEADGVVVDVQPPHFGVAKRDEKPKADAPASYETAIVACGFGRFHYTLMLALVPMCCAQLFSSGVTALIIPTAACDLQLRDFEKGTLNGATYLGNLVSGLVWGGLSDMFGRRIIIMSCFLLDFVASFALSFSPTYLVMLVLKVVSGVIMAGPNSVLYAYLAEIHDNKHRSLAIMMVGMFFAFSQVVQPVLAYLLLPLTFRLPLVAGVLDLTAWRVFLMVCALPSLVSGLLFLRLPESPKFLMSQGRREEALRVFRRLYAANTGQPPDSYPIKSLEAGEAGEDGEESARKGAQQGRRQSSLRRALHQFAPLFRKPYVSRIAMVIAIQVNIMICINSLRLWTPQLFALMEQYEFSDWAGKPAASTACQKISVTLVHQAQLQGAADAANATAAAADEACNAISGEVYLRSVVIGCVGTSSFIVSSWASKQFGNRPLLLASFPLAMVAALAMVWSTDSDMLMGLISTFSPLTAIGLTALSASTVELFPTSLRGVSVSMSIMAGRVASLCGNLILPTLLNFSCETLFVFITVCLGVCSVLVWFIPTKRKDEDR